MRLLSTLLITILALLTTQAASQPAIAPLKTPIRTQNFYAAPLSIPHPEKPKRWKRSSNGARRKPKNHLANPAMAVAAVTPVAAVAVKAPQCQGLAPLLLMYTFTSSRQAMLAPSAMLKCRTNVCH